MYAGVEFENDGDEGSISIVGSAWLTPKKKETFWPNIKRKEKFDKLVKANSQPSDDWKIFKIKRVFFETDDYEKAHKKIKLCEMTSDIQTDIDDDVTAQKRNVPKPSRFLEDFDNGSGSSESESENRNTIQRPPQFMIESRLSQTQTFNEEEVPSEPTLIITTPSGSGLLENKYFDEIETPRSLNFIRTLEIIKQNYTTIVKQNDVIIQQNNKIISLLEKKHEKDGLVLHAELPVQLPINTNEDFAALEDHISSKNNKDNLVLYFSNLGGRDVSCKVSTILKRTLTNELAKTYSFFGRRNGKKAFASLHLKDVIIHAVQKTELNAKVLSIEHAIKEWLKHAPQREKLNLRTSVTS